MQASSVSDDTRGSEIDPRKVLSNKKVLLPSFNEEIPPDQQRVHEFMTARLIRHFNFPNIVLISWMVCRMVSESVALGSNSV